MNLVDDIVWDMAHSRNQMVPFQLGLHEQGMTSQPDFTHATSHLIHVKLRSNAGAETTSKQDNGLLICSNATQTSSKLLELN